jgi:serine protease DegQ
MHHRRLRWAQAGGLLCAALLTGCAADTESAPDPGSGTGAGAGAESASPAPATASPEAEASGSPFGAASIPDIVERVEPSVVTILRPGGGLGSGVVYNDEGVIVTNEHVIRGATDVEVVLADGTRIPGRVLAADPGTDLAAVAVDREGLPPASFDEQLPRPGELAIAIGSPQGFEGTVTAGIVSGLGRAVPGSAEQTTALVDLIQTDAAISPGNSGGALVDADGEVIGINGAYLPPQTGAVAIGFAIPTATVVDVVEDLLDDGQVTRPFVGIRPGRLTAEVVAQLGLAADAGVLVLAVVPGSPAEDAGILGGDVLVSVNGEPVESIEEFLGQLRRVEPGEEVELEVVRGAQERTVRLQVASATG